MRRAKGLLLALALAASPYAASANPALLDPPAAPVVVRVHFELHDVLAIDDTREEFDFTGVLTLTWSDPRQAFDAADVGTDEKIYQGNYQFNELSPGWYPQLVLVNQSAPFDSSAVVLRVRPDGTSTLVQTLTSGVRVDLDMRLFPFDGHRLEVVLLIPGFDRDEIRLEVDPAGADLRLKSDVPIPQWRITGSGMSVRERPEFHAGSGRVASAFVVSLDVERLPFHVVRLVVLPLVIVVGLSFSVFWMDRSSLGDRLSVSFIGILTSVAYQMVIRDSIPHISYFTLVHGFLHLSFFTMCATVVINLVVGMLDKSGRVRAGDLVDYRCRGIFPLAYVTLNALMALMAFTLFG